MKLKIIGLLFFVLMSSTGFSQSQSAQDKIEAARIALINQRLDLSPEEAEKFWPLYREYSKQRESLKREYLNARKEFRAEGMSEEESKRLLDIGLALKERELDLDKKYTQRLNTVISNRQLIALRKAEDDFRKMLLERLKEQSEQRQKLYNRRQRRNDN